MRSFNELLQKAEPQSHMVQFYGAQESVLLSNLTGYIVEGLSRLETVLVIASHEHAAAVTARLDELGEGTTGITFVDAQAALESFMVDGQPDLGRFDATIGQMVRDLSGRAGESGIRAYGEMVGILWASGQFSAAIRLEHIWNELLNSVVFNLFCGYPIDVFDPAFKSASVDELLCAHSHVIAGTPQNDLQSALNRAMDDVLGSKVVELRPLMKSAARPAWPDVPKPEATILWLRNHLPHYAETIIDRARTYFEGGLGNATPEI